MKNRSVSYLLAASLALAAPALAQKSTRKAPSKGAETSGAKAEAAAASPVLMNAMQQELQRAMQSLAKADPAPYFISYSTDDHENVSLTASEGAMMSSSVRHTRQVDVVIRVATPALDNTHEENRPSGISSALLPLDDDSDSISHALWQVTDREYKKAARTFLQVKTNTAVRAEEEDKSADFSQEKPETAVAPLPPPANIDVKTWEERLRRYSAVFRKHPDVYRSIVTLEFEDGNHYFVSSEGTRLTSHEPLAHLIVMGETRADDGMELVRAETFDASNPSRLAGDDTILADIEKIATDLEKLRVAPVVEPYDGPALLSGRAAAVFFHEVLGHRVEGHRQRGIEEGQTFTKKVNQPVLPSFLSVVDDPTIKQLDGVDLNGYYQFDDEGVAAQKVEVIHDGVLREFLMGRMPVKGFDHSNGHGRAQDGLMPVGRQGNLIVTSSSAVSDADLRKQFIDEIKKQNKPYGLYFEDIEGGFTLTTRESPQAFQVLPVMVWRVYADGRPDELVRGVDIVGTPLAAMMRIMKTGDKTQVFNGICGAESGSVPVAAAAPAMLFSEIEVQKQAQTHDRPPILPAPGAQPTPRVAAGQGGQQ